MTKAIRHPYSKAPGRIDAIRLGLWGAAVLGLHTACSAQRFDAPTAAEVAQLERLIGTWEGSGTIHEPDAPEAISWTGRRTARWILGGHFVQEDLRIEFEAGQNGAEPIAVRRIYGWDPAGQNHVAVVLGARRQAVVARGTIEGASMVYVCSDIERSRPVAHRWILQHEGSDRQVVRAEASTADGPWTPRFRGTFERLEVDGQHSEEARAGQVDLVEASFGTERTSPFEASLAGSLDFMLGQWKVTGKMRPQPDVDPVGLVGSQSANALFDGSALHVELRARAADDATNVLERTTYYVWNPASTSYDRLEFSNCGGIQRSVCAHVDDEHIAAAHACLARGKPMSQQTVITRKRHRDRAETIEIATSVLYGTASVEVECSLALERSK